VHTVRHTLLLGVAHTPCSQQGPYNKDFHQTCSQLEYCPSRSICIADVHEQMQPTHNSSCKAADLQKVSMSQVNRHATADAASCCKDDMSGCCPYSTLHPHTSHCHCTKAHQPTCLPRHTLLAAVRLRTCPAVGSSSCCHNDWSTHAHAALQVTETFRFFQECGRLLMPGELA
jgi:hypothetical protein